MTFPHGQPILLQYMISFQFGLTQLPLSDSQELYLDLPGPKERPADSDDDDDDEDVEEDEEEGKDERAEMLRVPIPSPSSVPVLGETKRSDPLEQDVRENDVVITSEPGVNREVEIGIYQQECICWSPEIKIPGGSGPIHSHACHHERDTDFKGWRNQDPCGRTQQITGSIEVSCL